MKTKSKLLLTKKQTVRHSLQMYSNLMRKLLLAFNDELKNVQDLTFKINAEVTGSKSKFMKIEEEYRKGLKDTVKMNKEIENKSSKIKQLEVEISHLQDVVSTQKEKIISLTKDDSELSHYRNSSNSINSVELNNDM